MHATFILCGGFILYFLFYKLYGSYLQKRIVGEEKQPPPAIRLQDNIDFVPTNKYVLFGHHFASIAGAAPIVGPVIALIWGWLPALLWIWIGNVFMGATHDYLSLMASVRYDGHSIQWIAGKVIKKRTGYFFAWFILFVLILLVAAFGAILGKIFVAKPQVPSTYFLQIVAALILGVLLYRLRTHFWLATLIGIGMLIGAIILGIYFPITAGYKTWMLVFFFYIIVAASLPVHVLLQPRDYLNAWLLVAGLILGGLAVLFSFKEITLFAFTSFNVPLIAHRPTPFWPVIPLIIACGSLSGFHALVGSGTTSKQLSKEIEGLFIGYGSMLTEGFLSTLVVAVVSAYGLNVLAPDIAIDLKTNAFTFAQHYGKAINSAGGPVGFFSKAYGLAVHSVLGLPKEFVTILAAMWVASFAMTTLDTTNRLARYTLTEICEPLKESLPFVFQFITNRWTASLIPAVIGIGLAWTGAWSIIWPAFGGANQMLASIALMTVSAWVIRVQKKSGWVCLIPALFLWITVTLAIGWYLFVAVPVFMTKNPAQAYTLGIIILIMLFLDFLLIYDFFKPTKPEPPNV